MQNAESLIKEYEERKKEGERYRLRRDAEALERSNREASYLAEQERMREEKAARDRQERERLKTLEEKRINKKYEEIFSAFWRTEYERLLELSSCASRSLCWWWVNRVGLDIHINSSSDYFTDL